MTAPPRWPGCATPCPTAPSWSRTAPRNRRDLLAAVAAEIGDGPARARPESDPLAVLVSAVRASDSQRETQRAAFHARAARGRPEPVDASGVSTSLNYDGQQYALQVFQTGPHTYRIDSGDAVAEVAIDRANDFEWTVTAAGRERHVVIASHGTGCLLEIDGIAHRVDRDEGIAVRAQWPALIVSVAVAPGQDVAEGDPLVVAEAMKMESTLRAPFAGTITSVEVLPNEQVDAGAPLVLIRPATRGDVESTVQPTNGSRVSFAGMALADTSGRPPFERVYAALRGYLLGYELDPASLSALLAEQRSFANRASAGDTKLLAAEDGFLDLFTDLGLLWQSEREGGAQSDLRVTTAREYLLGYIQWLDPDRVGPARPDASPPVQGPGPLRRDRPAPQPGPGAGRRPAVRLPGAAPAAGPRGDRHPRATPALPRPHPAVRRRLGAHALRPPDRLDPGAARVRGRPLPRRPVPVHRRAGRGGRARPDAGPHGGPPRRPCRGPQPPRARRAHRGPGRGPPADAQADPAPTHGQHATRTCRPHSWRSAPGAGTGPVRSAT